MVAQSVRDRIRGYSSGFTHAANPNLWQDVLSARFPVAQEIPDKLFAFGRDAIAKLGYIETHVA